MSNNESLVIPEDEPFKNDKLNRKPIADNLTMILKNRNDSFVLSIDSGWGTGKTTFIKMWVEQLKIQKEMIPIYFNVWENDDFDDPLLAIISKLIESEGTHKENNEILEKIKKYSIPIVKSTLLNVIQKITLGSINKGTLEEIDKFGKDEPDIFNKFNEYKAIKIKLRDVLIELQEQKGKKIVFFIDELDRCRPSFAIETLERIKHFFDIPGFIFVLSVDREQLAHSVRGLYGQDMDSVGYLRRFIDLEFRLPEPDLYAYVHYLKENFVDDKKFDEKNVFFWEFLPTLLINFKCSLRDVNKFFKLFNICLLMTDMANISKIRAPEGDSVTNLRWQISSFLYAFLISIKIKEPELYKDFVNCTYKISNEADERELLNKMNMNEITFNETSDFIREQYGQLICRFYKIHYLTAKNKIDDNRDLYNFTFVYQGDSKENKVSLSYLWDGNTRSRKMELRILKHIELMDNFESYDEISLKAQLGK
jgi:hypothetical protein